MISILLRGRIGAVLAVAAVIMSAALSGRAENCQTATDMDAATRSALSSLGQHYFDMIAKGDTALRTP
jgi:hypothetical protein